MEEEILYVIFWKITPNGVLILNFKHCFFKEEKQKPLNKETVTFYFFIINVFCCWLWNNRIGIISVQYYLKILQLTILENVKDYIIRKCTINDVKLAWNSIPLTNKKYVEISEKSMDLCQVYIKRIYIEIVFFW